MNNWKQIGWQALAVVCILIGNFASNKQQKLDIKEAVEDFMKKDD